MSQLTLADSARMLVEDADDKKRALFGKLKIITVGDLLYRSWVNLGASRTGKGVVLHFICWLYSQLGFKIVYLDLSSFEGGNVNESGFFSLPFPKDHPLYDKVCRIHGEAQPVKVQVYRPLLFLEGLPVGLGILNPAEKIPANVHPYTVALSDLDGSDWLAIMGNLAPGGENLLLSAVRETGPTEETSILDVIWAVEKLANQQKAEFLPNIPMPADTPGLKVGSRAFDKKSVPGILRQLQRLANSGVIMPRTTRTEAVKTNLDLEAVIKNNDWLSFNFSPAIPRALTFGLMRFIIHRLLELRDEKIVFAIPELSNLAPRQIPEEQESYAFPMREQLRILGSQQAKSGKIIVGDSQKPHQLDPILLDSLRYRCLFAQRYQDLEELIRGHGVPNAQSLISNLRLVLRESKHYFIYLPPDGPGSIIPGNAIPPFRTHVTGEGEYDQVYARTHGAGEMVDVKWACTYVGEVMRSSHQTIAKIQDAEEAVLVEARKKAAAPQEKKMALRTLEILTAAEPTILLKDWAHAMTNAGVSEGNVYSVLRKWEKREVLVKSGDARKRVVKIIGWEMLKELAS